MGISLPIPLYFPHAVEWSPGSLVRFYFPALVTFLLWREAAVPCHPFALLPYSLGNNTSGLDTSPYPRIPRLEPFFLPEGCPIIPVKKLPQLVNSLRSRGQTPFFHSSLFVQIRSGFLLRRLRGGFHLRTFPDSYWSPNRSPFRYWIGLRTSGEFCLLFFCMEP